MLIGGLPDPTSPEIAAVTSIAAGFLGTTYAFWQGVSRDEVQWTTFRWAYFGVGFGLLIYCANLIAELY